MLLDVVALFFWMLPPGNFVVCRGAAVVELGRFVVGGEKLEGLSESECICIKIALISLRYT